MLATTLAAIKALLNADTTVGPTERKRLLNALTTAPVAPTAGDQRPDRILTPKEAAARLGRTTRTLARLADEGHIERVVFPGRKRGCGFRESDITKIIAGSTL